MRVLDVSIYTVQIINIHIQYNNVCRLNNTLTQSNILGEKKWCDRLSGGMSIKVDIDR